MNTTTPLTPLSHQDDVVAVRAQDRVASGRGHKERARKEPFYVGNCFAARLKTRGLFIISEKTPERRKSMLRTKRERSEIHGFCNYTQAIANDHRLGAAIVVAAPGMVSAQAAKMGGEELLPANAKPGECLCPGPCSTGL